MYLFIQQILDAYNMSAHVLGKYDQYLGTSSMDNRWGNDKKRVQRDELYNL